MGCGGSKQNAPPHGGGKSTGDGFFVLHDADFVGRDERTTTEGCASLEQAAELLGSKPHRFDVCYAWRGKESLVTIPVVAANEMGNGAKWTSSKGTDLVVYAKDTGHRAGGKMLIALKDVDCCFGDGSVFNGVHGYDAALRKVIEKNNPGMTAYFLHTPSNRLIEKPKNRGANWVGYPNYGWLFLWADKKIGDGSVRGKVDPPETAAEATAVVMGTVVPSSEAVPAAVVVAANGEGPTLIEMVGLLKHELNLEGNVSSVVAASCEMLGVETKGKTLLDQAKECYTLLGGGSEKL